MDMVRLPAFTGDSKDFQTWWIRFSVFASASRFKSVVDRYVDPNMPLDDAEVLDLTTADSKLAAKAKQKNEFAIANLPMALLFKGMVGLIDNSMDTAWPNGLACYVVDSLFKCFVPQDRISCI